MCDEIKCVFCGAVYTENSNEEFLMHEESDKFICSNYVIGFYNLFNTDDDELDTVLIQ